MPRRKRGRPGRSRAKVPPQEEEATPVPSASRIRGWKKWALRITVAILAPILALCFLEGTLRLFGYGHDSSFFVQAEDGVYVTNPKFGWRFFPPELSRDTTIAALSARKPDNTYRIFVFGGSAAQGTPDPAFAFSRILEAMLNDRLPGTHFEVINTGMTAINSHVVLPIAQECVGFDGDLYIVYLGNNEVIGPYGAGTVLAGYSPWLFTIRAGIALRSLRLGQLLGNTTRSFAPKDSQPKEWGGMEMFLANQVPADDPRLDAVYAHFRANLEDICAAGRKAGAPVILSTVLTNLTDYAPFASLHRDGLSDEALARWSERYEKAIALEEAGQYEQAIEQYKSAGQIDDRFAELHFRIGRCRLALGRFDLAGEDLAGARDLDALRFRADSRINDVIREVATKHKDEGVLLLDAERRSQAYAAPQGILDSDLLYEHVHLRFEGNYVVASALFETVLPLLPLSVRGPAGDTPTPPSLDRCAKLITYTAFDHCNCTVQMLKIISEAPFTGAEVPRMEAEFKGLQEELTAEAMARMAAQYREAVARRPDDWLTRLGFARLQSMRKNYEPAVSAYRTLLKRFPNDGFMRHQLATALGHQGKAQEVIDELRRLLRVDWPMGELVVRRALGAALVKTGDVDGGIREYENALAMEPDDEGCLIGVSDALVRSGRIEEAEQHLRSAVKRCPTSATLHHDLGVALARRAKFAEALPQLQKAVELNPDSALFRFSLAKANHDLGYMDEARRQHEEAVRLDANFAGRSLR